MKPMTTLTDGQRFLDVPVYARPRPELCSATARAVQKAFGHEGPKLIVLRHQRAELEWMKPGPGGTLVPLKGG